jgi:hypothetical protein
MFWRLILAHVVSDFLLQTKSVVGNKHRLKANLIHGLVLLIVSTVIFIDMLDFRILLMLFSISVVHGLIDYGKSYLDRLTGNRWNWLLFLLDQLLHIVSIYLLLTLFYPGRGEIISREFLQLTGEAGWLKGIVFFIFITAGGSYFTSSVCKRFTARLDDDDSLQNAGQYIGVLERIVIAAAILIGRFELIGFLIAAKSIIRHNSKKDRSFSEYFLIGTLTSFLWAGLFTYLYILVR